jgi:hypothetical protein
MKNELRTNHESITCPPLYNFGANQIQITPPTVPLLSCAHPLLWKRMLNFTAGLPFPQAYLLLQKCA